MIADLDRTIEQLLIDEIPIKNGEIDVKFDQPRREWSAKLSRPTINLFLYDVRENNVLRQHQWERVAVSNGRVDDQHAQLKRTPYRVDCLYMITAWAADPQDEHRLLTRCMLALFRFPLLPEARLLGDLADQPFPLQTRLASHDRLTNPAEVWGSLDNEIRPTVSYIVTLAMDPWAVVDSPVVRTRTLRTGPTEGTPRDRRLAPDAVDEKVVVAGTLRREGQPVGGVPVRLQETGQTTVTNELGHFQLGSLQPGIYTLQARPGAGPARERSILVPGDDYDIEL